MLGNAKQLSEFGISRISREVIDDDGFGLELSKYGIVLLRGFGFLLQLH